MLKLTYGVILTTLFATVYSDDFVCVPGTTYLENNCNNCLCTSSGMLKCGFKKCVYEWRFTSYNCNPGESYFEECNQCWCVEFFGTVCTNRKCA